MDEQRTRGGVIAAVLAIAALALAAVPAYGALAGGGESSSSGTGTPGLTPVQQEEQDPRQQEPSRASAIAIARRIGRATAALAAAAVPVALAAIRAPAVPTRRPPSSRCAARSWP